MAPQSKQIAVTRMVKRAIRSPMAKVNAVAQSRQPWLPPGKIRSSIALDKTFPLLPKHSTKQSELAAKPKKNVDLKNRSQEAVMGAAASASGDMDASADNTAGHTPRAGVANNPSIAVAVETPYFTAKDYKSCTVDGFESAAYWIEHICLAESDGKHWLAAEFFDLAFKCQSQPIHRIICKLMDYMERHESAIPFFGRLTMAHGLQVKPKFRTEDIIAATSDMPSKCMPSGGGFDEKQIAIAGAADQKGKVTKDMALASVDQLELEELVNDAANI